MRGIRRHHGMFAGKVRGPLYVVCALVVLVASMSLSSTASLALDGPAQLGRPDFIGLSNSESSALDQRVTWAETRSIDSDEIERIVALRSTLGLNSARNFVTQLNRDPRSFGGVWSDSSDFAGLVVTVDEAVKLSKRNRLQDSLRRMNRTLQSMDVGHIESRILRNTEGGSYEAGLLFARPLTAIESAKVKSEVVSNLDSKVSISIAPLDSGVLESLGERLASVALSEGIALSGYSLDYWSGIVRATVPTQADSDRLRSAIPFENVEITLGGLSIPTANKDQVQPYGLVHSSLAINIAIPSDPDHTSLCTSAFAVQGAYGNFLLTAGHCASLNMPSWQGGASLGTVAARNYRVYFCCDDRRFDAAAITTSNVRPQWGRIHVNSGDWGHRITGTIGANTDSLGDVYCHSGITTSGLDGYSGPACGVLNSRSFAPTGYMYNPLAVFRTFDTWSRPGDSGGGVYWDTIYGSLAVAIVSGSTGNSADDAIASHLPFVLDAWGLSVMTN
jgi:hypothetical protein